jgi:hypothetical protein
MGKISILLRCCFDPSFGGEEKHRYTTVHFEFLGSGSGVENLCLRVYGVMWNGK